MAEQQAPSRVVKLSDACLQSLITSPTDPLKLYDLSVHELVDLNNKLLLEHKATKEELSQLKANRYHVDPPVVQDRVGGDMYKRVSTVTSAWEPATRQDVCCRDMSCITNMRSGQTQLVFCSTTGQVSYQSGRQQYSDYSNILAYESVISSPLLLYRLCCLFEAQVNVDGPEGYKVVWSIYLKHKASGVFVGFSEWKGSALYRASNFPPTGTTFDEDWLPLLNLLLDPCCPHPYDGTVSGSVA
ncbi:TPA: hypothetical protein ACH3X2_008246 [Trebouxia sp. C0005]